jgi:multimeric flavodoxin WrbA
MKMKTVLINILNENENIESIQENINRLIDIDLVDLRIHDIRSEGSKHCKGCWNCWWKTPGRCIHKDDIEKSYGDFINSDQAVVMVGIKSGFLNYQSKRFLDRLIPIIHPYIDYINNEFTHRLRYDHYPHIIFALDPTELSEDEYEVLKSYLARFAFHYRSNVSLLDLKEKNVEKLGLPKLLAYTAPKLPAKTPKRLAIYNGSPRGRQSNSVMIIDNIVDAMEGQYCRIDVKDLLQLDLHEEYVKVFTEYDHHLIVYPLYMHAMPSIVKRFMERIDPVENGETRISFIIQSGFPESVQSFYIRPYHRLLANRLNLTYGGTVVKGGVEGIRIMSEKARRKKIDPFIDLGKELITQGYFSKALIDRFAEPLKMSKGRIRFFKILGKTGLTDFYWIMNLRKHKAFKQRFDQPYDDRKTR